LSCRDCLLGRGFSVSSPLTPLFPRGTQFPPITFLIYSCKYTRIIPNFFFPSKNPRCGPFSGPPYASTSVAVCAFHFLQAQHFFPPSFLFFSPTPKSPGARDPPLRKRPSPPPTLAGPLSNLSRPPVTTTTLSYPPPHFNVPRPPLPFPNSPHSPRRHLIAHLVHFLLFPCFDHAKLMLVVLLFC